MPGDSRGHGAGPSPLASFPLLRAKRPPPRTQPGTSHSFPKGQLALGFVVKPQNRSLFHLRHCSEPTRQHCLHSRFSSGFPNYFIDFSIFQGIDIILTFGGKMRFPSLPPASLPVSHHCCLCPGCRKNPLSPGTSRGLKIRNSFLSVASSHREGWKWEQAGRESKAPSRIMWSLTTLEFRERFGASKDDSSSDFSNDAHAARPGWCRREEPMELIQLPTKSGKAFLFLPAVPCARGKLTL